MKSEIKTNYLGLIKELALTDFKLKYQGSILGYLWSLVKPLMLFSVLYFVFTQIFKIGKAIEHYPVYLLLGVVMWGFFTEVTAGSLDAIAGKGELIRKVYFPRIVLVISRSITSLLTFLLNLIVVLVFMVCTGVNFHLKMLAFPFLIFEYLILVMGISFFLSSLYVKFRDIAHIWEVVLQALFYATPIIYPLTLVPPRIAKVLMLSPVTQMIQDARYLLITNQSLTSVDYLFPRYYWIPYMLPFIIFVVGYWIFNKSAAKFAENV